MNASCCEVRLTLRVGILRNLSELAIFAICLSKARERSRSRFRATAWSGHSQLWPDNDQLEVPISADVEVKWNASGAGAVSLLIVAVDEAAGAQCTVPDAEGKLVVGKAPSWGRRRS